MKKKLILIGILIMLIIPIILLVLNIRESYIYNSIDVREIYNMYKDNVHEGIKYLWGETDFDNLTQSNKIKKMGTLLKIYEANKVILNLTPYDNQSESYSFTENNEFKALGIVSLKEWNPYMN